MKKSKERRNEYQEKGRKNSEKLEVRRIKVDAKVEQGVTNKEKGEAKVRTGVRTKNTPVDTRSTRIDPLAPQGRFLLIP